MPSWLVDKILGLNRNADAATRDGLMATDAAERWLGSLRTGPILASVNLIVTTLVADRR